MLSFRFTMALAWRIAMPAPQDIQIIGTEVAIRWDDGQESFITFATLRAASPSAEVKGERDIFGHQYGGEVPRDYRGVEVQSWEKVGNYAIRFDFSDGHRTGLYSYELLRKLGGAGASDQPQS
jgi:DUF971 family protein